MVEHRSRKAGVIGSSPIAGSSCNVTPPFGEAFFVLRNPAPVTSSPLHRVLSLQRVRFHRPSQKLFDLLQFEVDPQNTRLKRNTVTCAFVSRRSRSTRRMHPKLQQIEMFLSQTAGPDGHASSMRHETTQRPQHVEKRGGTKRVCSIPPDNKQRSSQPSAWPHIRFWWLSPGNTRPG